MCVCVRVCVWLGLLSLSASMCLCVHGGNFKSRCVSTCHPRATENSSKGRGVYARSSVRGASTCVCCTDLLCAPTVIRWLAFGSCCTLTMMPALFSAVGVPSPLQEPQAPSPRPLFNQARRAQGESDCVGAKCKAFAHALILLSLTHCLASAFPKCQIPHASHMPALAAATSCNPRCVCVCVWGGDVCGTCFFHVSICFGWHQPTIECPCCLPDRTSLCLSAFGETHPDVKWAMERTISVPVSSLDSCNSGKLQRGNGQ